MATKAQLQQDLINAVAKIRVSNQGAPMDVKFSDGKTYTVYSDGSGAGDALGIDFRGLTNQFNAAESALRPAPAPTPLQPQPQQQQQQSAPLSQDSSKSFALQNANAAFFPNLDANGLPILNRSAIDAELQRTGRNALTANNSDIRDQIYGSGWNSKSDAVQVLNGAAVYGVSKVRSGMGGFAFEKPQGGGATDADFINAAKMAGLDPNQYYSKQNLGPMGSLVNALDKNALYNALQEKGKDLYSVTNALQAAARGATAPHATILFRADGDELKAISNPQTNQPAVSYFDAVRYKPDPGIMGDLAPFLMLAPAIGGILGAAGAGASTAGLTAGEVAANTAGGFVGGLPGVEAGALMAGYTGAPLNALGISAGLGGAGWMGADTLDNIIASAIADTYNPSAPGYQVGPEGPAKIGTQQFPLNDKIGSSSILQDLKNGYEAYKTGSKIANSVNQILGNNPDQGLGGIDPTTGIAGALSSLSAGRQLGALPNEGQGVFLQGAPVGESTALQPMQLQQLSPELGAVDPQLLSQLLNKNKPAMGGPQQGSSHYTYGAIPAMQDTTYTGAPGALLSGKPVSQYDPLGSAGLRQISGYKDGGDVEAHNPEFITGKTGFYVEGKGDGQSDSIPAMLADGEYVFDADTVAALGNGSNKAGALVLDKMRHNIRKHKRSASHKTIPPKAKSPLEYLKG